MRFSCQNLVELMYWFHSMNKINRSENYVLSSSQIKGSCFVSIKVEIRFSLVDQKSITSFDINTMEQFQRNPIFNSTAYRDQNVSEGLGVLNAFCFSKCSPKISQAYYAKIKQPFFSCSLNFFKSEKFNSDPSFSECHSFQESEVFQVCIILF